MTKVFYSRLMQDQQLPDSMMQQILVGLAPTTKKKTVDMLDWVSEGSI